MIKTIDIQAKEWFDRINGNSYFSAVITVNYGMETEQTFRIPFTYGYGEYYVQNALELLNEKGIINAKNTYDLRQSGIILRTSKKEKCLKRELIK